MSEERINVGGAPNDGTGDSVRAAFTKSNADFDDLYNQISTLGAVATPTSHGLVMPDDATLTVSSTGVLSAVTATPANPGVVKPDGTTLTLSGNLLSVAPVGIGRGYANKFRNSGMDVAQRGTSGSVAQSTTVYTLDGWQISNRTTNPVTWTQVYAANLSGNALRLGVTSSASTVALQQRIESVLAGQLLGDSGPQAITVRFAIHNGTIADITPTLTTAYAASQDNFSSSTTDINSVSLQTVAAGTTGLVAYTFVPNAAIKNGYQIALGFANVVSGSIDVSHADVRATPTFPAAALTAAPPAAEVRPVGVELAICQRYLAKTFPQATAPAQGTGVTAGAIIYRALYSGADYWGAAWRFPVTMRAAPTITYFNPIGANANWRNLDTGADSGSTAAVEVPTGDQMVFPLNLQLSSDGVGQRIAIHALASAEL